MHSTFDEAVYDAVKKIPRGRVASYGTVALLAGYPRAARAVGMALHRNTDPEHVPCYRVVTADGRVSKAFVFGGANVQYEMLRRDGVEFDDTGRVKREFFI